MAAEAGGGVRAGIGTRLRAAREKKGLTILQAAEKLHVDPRIVESLETEDFAALGAAVYARGHLRHYAELIGEQPAELQELYSHSTRAAPAQPDLTKISRPPPEPDSGKLAGPAVVVLIVMVAAGTVWWWMSHPTEKPAPALVQSGVPASSTGPGALPNTAGDASEGSATGGAGASTAGEHSATSAPSARPRGSVGKAGANVAASAGGSTSAGIAASGSAASGAGPPGARGKPQTASGAAMTAAAQTRLPAPGAAPTGTAPAAAPHLTSLTTPTAPPTSRGKEGQLTLKFSSDSWAEIYDATGQRLFYDVGAASTAHTVKGPAPMRVILGNGAGVTLEFNGRPTAVPTSTSADGSVRFTINAHGRAVPVGE